MFAPPCFCHDGTGLVHWVSLKPDFRLAYRGVDLFKSDFGDGETDFAMFADLLGLWVYGLRGQAVSVSEAHHAKPSLTVYSRILQRIKFESNYSTEFGRMEDKI